VKSQAELNAAMVQVEDTLAQVGVPAGPLARFTRLDLVWQFPGEPGLWMQAHRYARHPRIRRDVVRYDGQSLHWKGSLAHVRIYDKVLEVTGRPGNIVRVEVELHGRLLKELLADGTGPVCHLDFDQLYQAYRGFMTGFAPATVPQGSGIADLLARGERCGWHDHGVSAFEIWSQGKHPEHVRRMQRQMAVLRPQEFGLDWNQLLPPDGPPPAMEPMEEPLVIAA
jgi:hypothetical protein